MAQRTENSTGVEKEVDVKAQIQLTTSKIKNPTKTNKIVWKK